MLYGLHLNNAYNTYFLINSITYTLRWLSGKLKAISAIWDDRIRQKKSDGYVDASGMEKIKVDKMLLGICLVMKPIQTLI